MDRSEIYYNEATRQTKEQEESRKHFDSMATTVLGFSAVVLSLLLFKTDSLQSYQIFLFWASFTSFLGVAVSTISVLWLRNWEFSPPLSDLRENIESAKYEDEAIILWTSNAMSDSLYNNKKYLRYKAYSLRFAYVFLSLEVLSMGLMIVVTIFV
jgi:hypothetical protein